MPSLFSRIADLIVAKPGTLSKTILVLMVISLIVMTMVTMETGNSTYMNKNSPEGILSDHYTETFQKETVILLVESGDSTSPVLLQYLDSIEEPIKRLGHVTSITSIADIIKSLNNGVLPTSSGEMNEVLAKVPENIRKGYVPSGMLNMASISLDSGLSDAQKTTTLANLQSFIDSTNPPPGISIKLTGSSAFQQQMKTEMGKSMGTLILAALVLMVLVMGLLFGYVNHRFLPVVIVTAGLIFTFGFIGLAGVKISMAVISAFPVMIGLGIDYAIQFHSRLEEEARDNPLSEAIRTTITKTGPAVMYAMLATCMGFFAMFISPVPMMQGFGMVSIIGVVTCYLTSLIGIPLIAILINYQAKGHGVSKQAVIVDSVLSKTAVWIGKRPVPVLMVILFVAFIGIQLDPRIPVNTNENSFVPPDMPAKTTLDKVTRTIGSTDSAPIVIHGSNVLSFDSVQWMKEFTDLEVKTRSKITRGTSIADYVITYNNGVVPETQSELDAALAKIPESVRNSYVNGNNEAVIQFYTVKLTTTTKSDLKDDIEGDLKLYPPPPGIKADVTGSFAVFTNLVTDIVESKDLITYTGFLLVVLFLAAVYRNINAITPIVPIAAVVGWNAVAMYVLGIDYNVMTACLGSMTIGVAAEYTILVMERYIEEKEKTPNVIEALGNSVSKIGSAIMVSGFATFFGFSALILSTFPIISNFGLTTIIAVLFSLIGAIAGMPAILAFVDKIIHGVEELEEEVEEVLHLTHSHK
ncbi:MAG: hydrophobe/amphiphile efflux-3 (HAE3) family transporter [Methanospirillum sp.]|uniref:efflux RND transporter permease subunit n=1 Tax=Methanospirillum sp. TaxID=45200 RepID=UPI00236CFA77|nr:hydrophobe/amphiphile efflux-3 (HAE3) family transporter [Methanospirillum sp.]MDD1728156.1 hydrophobe/amphiphile efflux-3 (HAE3) family transporter [Methanospirillum sp.]